MWLFAEIKEEVLDETDGLGAWQSYSDYYLESPLAEPFASEMASRDQSESEEALAMNSFSPVIDNTYSLIEGEGAEIYDGPPHLIPEGTLLDTDTETNLCLVPRRGRECKQTNADQVDEHLSNRKEPERRQPERKGKGSVHYFAKQPKNNTVSKQIKKKYRLRRNLDAASQKNKEEQDDDYDAPGKVIRGKRGEGDFSCKLCHYRFHTSNSLHMHQAVHLGETTCPVCRKFFSRKDDMQHHLYSAHYADQKIFLKIGKTKHCWICPKSVNSPSSLKIHIARDHLDFSHCPLCKEKFKSKASMLQHLYDYHDHKLIRKWACK